MRTTIEIQKEHRARLLELAARRGEKGFSKVVGEAIEAHLRAEAENNRSRRRALSVRGSLSPAEADRMRTELAALRKHWR